MKFIHEERKKHWLLTTESSSRNDESQRHGADSDCNLKKTKKTKIKTLTKTIHTHTQIKKTNFARK